MLDLVELVKDQQELIKFLVEDSDVSSEINEVLERVALKMEKKMESVIRDVKLVMDL